MFKPVARFITRLQGDSDGLFIGSVLKKGVGLFEPNSVYEMAQCEFSGDIIIRKVGEGLVAKTGKGFDSSPLGIHWAQTIEQVVDQGGRYLFLSREEFDSLPNSDEEGE